MDIKNNLIYFDNNATTRVDERVLAAMLPFFSEHYGNASSKLHPFGWVAQSAIEKAGIQLSQLLNCDPTELIFTSGATEAINLALTGIFEAYRNKGNHIITVATEHKAVLDTYEALKKKGAEITYLGVDKEGLIDTDQLKENIKTNTILLSVMAANNETGVLQSLENIAEICKQKKVLFFSDATQFVGKERCDIEELGVHALALSAHKFHGPKGVGALYVKRKNPRVSVLQQIHGGGHQNGRRSGTLNVPGIVAMGEAAELCKTNYWENSAYVSQLRNYFEHQLLDIPGLQINGSTKNRLYNTSNLTFPKNKNVISLITKFAFSSGSACTSGNSEPSHVLKAMGQDDAEIKNSFRFSFSKFNTLEEVELIVEEIFKL